MSRILDERTLDRGFALERERLRGRDGVDGLGVPDAVLRWAAGRDQRRSGRIEIENLVGDSPTVLAGEEDISRLRSAERLERVEAGLRAREVAPVLRRCNRNRLAHEVRTVEELRVLESEVTAFLDLGWRLAVVLLPSVVTLTRAVGRCSEVTERVHTARWSRLR